jgi:tetratricopeptide (TPR) repeat protein
MERGRKLLQFVHAGPMRKGYVLEQTDLTRILDTGTFNCVSSATLYNGLARRLGLDARGIEVPDHAFSILYDGTNHSDVETTTGLGFDPARDPQARKQFERETGFQYIPESHRDQRREIDEPGLVAIIYYNHGVFHTRDRQYTAALKANFCALSLDREFASAVQNTLGTLVKWSGTLADEGKFDRGLDVVRVGLALAPEDYSLRNNRDYLWQRAAEVQAAAGDIDGALATLDQAAAETPDEADQFRARQAWLFLRHGEELADARKYAEAIQSIQPGFAKLKGEALEDLVEWRNGVYLRWSNRALDEKDYETALKVLAEGLIASPGDYGMTNQIAYVAQQWGKAEVAAGREAQAAEVLIALARRFPDIEGVKDVGLNHVRRIAYDLRDAGKIDDALAAIERHRALVEAVANADTVEELKQGVYGGSVRSLVRSEQWQPALALLDKSLQGDPDNGELKEMLAYVVQEFGRATYKNQGEEAGRELLIELLARYPDQDDVQEVAENLVTRSVRPAVEEKRFEDALAAAKRHADVFRGIKDPDAYNELLVYVYDAWGHHHMREKNWPEAIKLYERALSEVPDESLLNHNLGYSRQELTKKK